ncbi:MAG: LysR family transcriptional regulator [Kofleriaceae bacterium]
MNVRADLFAGVLPFVRTAEERSFGRAATSLGVTTAAISKAVRRLEDDLGVKLLDRSSRTVTLTRAGELFLHRCRQAVLDVAGAREAVRGAKGDPQGEIAVTMPFILAPFVVPHLARFGAQHPRLTFRLSMSDRITRIADESFDVAVRMGELESSRLVTRHLRDTRWVTVAAPSYLARRSPPTSLAELANHNCLRFLAPDGRPRDWSFVDRSRPATVHVDGNLLIDHGSYLLAAAEAGMGVCQVLDFMVERSMRDGLLVEVLADAAAPGPKIHALSTPGRVRTAAVRTFIRFLVDRFRA